VFQCGSNESLRKSSIKEIRLCHSSLCLNSVFSVEGLGLGLVKVDDCSESRAIVASTSRTILASIAVVVGVVADVLLSFGDPK